MEPRVADITEEQQRALVDAGIASALCVVPQLLPWLPVSLDGSAGAVAVILPLFVALVVAWRRANAALRTSTGTAALVLLAGACLAIGLLAGADGLADTGKIIASLVAGSFAARFFERPSWVAGALVSIAAADAWSVWSSDGITHNLQDGDGGALARLLVVEIPGVGAGDPVGQFGVLDIIYIAFLLAVGRRWAIPVVRIALALVVALLAVNVAATLQPGFVPVLPFTSCAVVLALAPYLRAEWRLHRAAARGWASPGATRRSR